MKKYKKHSEYVGEKFGLLQINDFKRENKKGYFYCICDCGNEKWMRSDGVINCGHRSCGCVGSFKHGMSNTRIFNIWSAMRQRCINPKHAEYHRYGGRGISVCGEWLDQKDGFLNFYKWALNNGYKDSLTIDRIDVNGNYEPSNCRWATMLEQMNNIRRNCIIEIDGVKKTASEWSRESGLSRLTIKKRANEAGKSANILKPAKKAEFQSGVKGVKWDKSKNRWKVDTVENGKVKHLGYIKELSEAIELKNTYENKKKVSTDE